MSFSDYVLYRLARRWPSPMAGVVQELNAEPGTPEYHEAYAQRQFNLKVRKGLKCDVLGLDVLEVGAGHGGICCYLAAVGARSVIGVDLSDEALEVARYFVQVVSARYGPDYHLPVSFAKMSGEHLTFEDEQFDLVLADNAFEHFSDPEIVMREAFRVLRPGGALLVPTFSSILNKHGLHLKHGLKMPWAQLFFSEKTVIRAMYRLAKENPKLYELYPGLNGNPERVRDLRQYRDLNDITFATFKALAAKIGFRVEWFLPHGTRAGEIIRRLPGLRNTKLMDICSTDASAYLRKPGQLPRQTVDAAVARCEGAA